VKRIARLYLIPLLLLPALSFAQPPSAAQDAVWAREVAYWNAARANDLVAYRALWRDDFLGWPAWSTDPMRKAHTADWIVAHTGKGERLTSYTLERLTVQVSGDMATTTYRAHATWTNQAGKEHTEVSRILHTWRSDSDGTWRIFSGMSARSDGN
jgi:ketosteroid isomerase-like protein